MSPQNGFLMCVKLYLAFHFLPLCLSILTVLCWFLSFAFIPQAITSFIAIGSCNKLFTNLPCLSILVP